MTKIKNLKEIETKKTIQLRIPESQNDFWGQTKQNKNMYKKRNMNIIYDLSIEIVINNDFIGK